MVYDLKTEVYKNGSKIGNIYLIITDDETQLMVIEADGNDKKINAWVSDYSPYHPQIQDEFIRAALDVALQTFDIVLSEEQLVELMNSKAVESGNVKVVLT